MDNTTFWNSCYAEGKTGWDRGDVHPALTRWIKNGCLSPCSIIVPGCGRGHEVLSLAEQGFDVTAIDIANEPVQHLRKKLSGHETNSLVVQQSIFEFRPEQSVEAVYEQTCLCAINPTERSQYEEAAFQWLQPAGKLFVLFAQKSNSPDEGPPFHCDIEDMKEIFPESRWSWPISEDVSRFEHPSGKLFELSHVLTKRE